MNTVIGEVRTSERTNTWSTIEHEHKFSGTQKQDLKFSDNIVKHTLCTFSKLLQKVNVLGFNILSRLRHYVHVLQIKSNS